MKKLILTACGCACLLLPVNSIAAFDMNHGKWEFTTTMTMPMLPQPQVTTTTECITKEEAEQDPMADLVDSGNCKVTKQKTKGDTMTFEMECNESGMIMHGKGTFVGKGDTASGSTEMTMEMPEMPNMPAGMPTGPMTTTTTWEGKRVGTCE